MNIRAAAVVSKKVAKSAVERNRVRRALYRAVASATADTTSYKPLNIIFFIRTIPPDPITPAFAKDIATILHYLQK